MSEAVNHPAHYGGANNPYEAIEVIEAWGCNFNTGNAYKYLVRAGHKASTAVTLKEKFTEDYKKALWYLERQLEGVNTVRPSAMQRQPLVVPKNYWFDDVMAHLDASHELARVLRACCDQCSAHKLAASIAVLKNLIAGLEG